MTFFRLLLENLLYHRRGNLAVLLGVAVGTVKSRLARARGGLRSLLGRV